MESIKLSLYEKDRETGILENLLGTYEVEEHIGLIDKIYALKEDGELKVHLYLTTSRDVTDEEYEAIYDHYDGEAFGDMDLFIEEVEESYNPTWLFIFSFIDSLEEMENKIQEILFIHHRELERIDREI